MRRGNGPGAWGLYEWVMTGLLTVCATLLGVCAVLMWTYFPVVASSSNSSSVTKYESRIESALSALAAAGVLKLSARCN
jgi:predicted negative regulator of RcsB-dependent stress response